jgi:predicted PurR-regulated permease PerM
MKHITLPLAFAVVLGSATGCAHQQLTNRQVAIGVGAAVLIGLVIFVLATKCDESGHPEGCNFQ